MASNEQQQIRVVRDESPSRSLVRESVKNYSYEEVAPGAHRVDILEQLKSNIRQLEDLQGRFSFLLNEVQSLVKRPKF